MLRRNRSGAELTIAKRSDPRLAFCREGSSAANRRPHAGHTSLPAWVTLFSPLLLKVTRIPCLTRHSTDFISKRGWHRPCSWQRLGHHWTARKNWQGSSKSRLTGDNNESSGRHGKSSRLAIKQRQIAYGDACRCRNRKHSDRGRRAASHFSAKANSLYRIASRSCLSHTICQAASHVPATSRYLPV